MGSCSSSISTSSTVHIENSCSLSPDWVNVEEEFTNAFNKLASQSLTRNRLTTSNRTDPSVDELTFPIERVSGARDA